MGGLYYYKTKKTWIKKLEGKELVDPLAVSRNDEYECNSPFQVGVEVESPSCTI
jgi:hypothetical protein